MSVLVYLPLIVVVAMLAVAALSTVDPRVDRAFTRLALFLFRDLVETWGRKRAERKRLLQAVHSPQMYATYAAKSVLFGLLLGVATVVGGFYAGFALIAVVLANKEAVKSALPERFHFAFEPGFDIDPLGGLPGASAGEGGLPLDILVQFLPPGVVSTAAWLGSLIPKPVREWLLDRFAGGGSDGSTGTGAGGSTGGEVEIVIDLGGAGLLPDALPGLSLVQVLLTLVIAVVIGAAVAGATYQYRWRAVRRRAEERAARIDESLVRTISFIYALSRSGMLYPEIMRTVGQNRQAFGESAEEIAVIVKDMDLFGSHIVPAVQRVADSTPSDELGDFLDNFANVLRSGQNVPSYLRDQYEQRQEERVADQEQLLELFSALGEGYVAVLVAGPLFLITIVTIFGLLTGGLLMVVQFLVYLAVPMGNIGFLAYIDGVAEPVSSHTIPEGQYDDSRPPVVRRVDETVDRSPTVADGGGRVGGATADGVGVDVEETLRRLEAYERVRLIRWALERPIETATSNPDLLLLLTVPIAVLSIVGRWWLAGAGALAVTTVDDWLIQATLFVVGTYAVVRAVYSRRLRAVEDRIPDFLDTLANTNEAGMTFTESLQRVETSDLGALNREFERLLSDIQWGGRTEAALRRFAERLGSPTLARVVALITNSLEASGSIGPVIRIAANEARKVKRLQRKRRQEMLMYVVIVYLSFLVFLGIAIALKLVLVPAIPAADQLGEMGGSQSFGASALINPVGESGKQQYMTTLFHAAVLQALMSGFVAGKIGEESARDGAKHVTIMVAAAYGLFLLFG